MYMDPDGYSWVKAIVGGIKKGLNATLKFILQVDHFRAIIDTILTVIPGVAGFTSSIKAARAARALAAGGKAALNRSRKVIIEFMESELLPQIEKYAKKTNRIRNWWYFTGYWRWNISSHINVIRNTGSRTY